MALIRWQPRPRMRQIQQWHPFDGLDLFGTEMDRFFDWPFGGRRLAATDASSWGPPADVLEDEDGFHVRMDLPGMNKEQIQLTLDGNTLTIHGEKTQDRTSKENDYYQQERFVGNFSRSLVLPSAVDAQKITATYKDGVLDVSIAKSEAARPKQIQIHS
jgi:HSP20 family protein